MTQVIAALAQDKRQIVMVADRMVSDSDDSLQFEHEPKGQMLSYNAMVFASGTMHEPEIVNLSRQEIAGRMRVSEAVEILAKHYRAARRRRIEIEVLSKHGLMSFEEYHNKQRTLAEKTVETIEGELQSENNELDLDILFAGIDPSNGKAQLYVIEPPGAAYSHTEVGFCCIGSGARHADPVFAFYEYHPSMTAEEVLYVAYVAKRRGEMAGGVGKKTDAWIFSAAKGCRKVKQETLDELETTLENANLSDLHVTKEVQFEDKPEAPEQEV